FFCGAGLRGALPGVGVPRTYPPYGGRLLSPAGLARLDRYRQLIAASALRQRPIPQPSPSSRDAPAPWNAADGHGSLLDAFGAGAEGDVPQAHLLTAALRSPGSPPARPR